MAYSHRQAMHVAKENGHEMGAVFNHGVTFCKKCNAFISPKYNFLVNKNTNNAIYGGIYGYNIDLISSRCK